MFVERGTWSVERNKKVMRFALCVTRLLFFDYEFRIDAIEITCGIFCPLLDKIFRTFIQSFLAGSLALIEIVHIQLVAEIWQSEICHYGDSCDPDQEFDEMKHGS